MSTRGRPRKVRPVDLKVLSGPELRNIVALMPDLYSPAEMYAMQSSELVKAVLADGGETFKQLDLSKLNKDVFRSDSVTAYVVGLQDYVNGAADGRPEPPRAVVDTDEALSAPAALEAYRERVAQAKKQAAAEKAAAAKQDAPRVHVAAPTPKQDAGSDSAPLDHAQALLREVTELAARLDAKTSELRKFIEENF